MDRFDDILAAELRELRPAPRPAFAAELDERAAAGFPRRPGGGGAALLARVRGWFANLTPRRALLPGMAVAVVLVAVGTAVVSFGGSGSGSTSEDGGRTLSPLSDTSGYYRAAPPAAAVAGGGEAAEKAPSVPEVSGAEAGSESASAAGGGSAGIELESAPRAGSVPVVPSNSTSAASARQRDVERSAAIVLGTQPDRLSEASNKVFGVVHAANGIVLSSQINGNAHDGEASFDLLIPSGKLDDTLASLSDIAAVRSRHDTTADITAPTVNTSEELQDSRARVDSLLKQLESAETEEERELVEAELGTERRHGAALRGQLDKLNERASLSRVSVRIVAGDGAGVIPGADEGGDWGVGDAVHDAGRILATAGGVAIVGLAILGPIALILLVFWGSNRLRVRRLRERALG